MLFLGWLVPRLMIISSALVIVTTRVAPQGAAVTVKKLTGPGTPLAESFTRISAIRELRDGRVLISDEAETRIVVADFASGVVQQVGQKGKGPGEYVQVARIWPLGGDSTLVKEPFGLRWLILDGVRVVATLGPGERAVAAAAMAPLLGTDTLGRVVTQLIGNDRGGRPSLDEPFKIVRLDRRTLRLDTIGRLQHTELWRQKAVASAAPSAVPAGAGGAPNRPRRYSMSINAPDDVAVFADGWVAVARTDPYRVDWCAPHSACAEGRPLPGARRAMTTREKQAYLDAAQVAAGWPPTTDVEATFGWPTDVPPFAAPSRGLEGGAVFAMPDGRAMIARVPTADVRANRYDIVTRNGVLAAQLELPLNERVIGFGAKTIYVRRVNSDGEQFLRRHSWP